MQRFESLEPRRFLAGDLTSSFGDRGRLTLGADATAVDVVEQNGGKLIVLSVNQAKTQSTLQRLNANGSVDSSFTPRTFAASELATQLKQASDGSLLLLSGGTLRKLTASGTVDSGFRIASGLGGFDMTSDGGLYGFTQNGISPAGAPADERAVFSNVIRRFRSNGTELSRKTLSVPTLPNSSGDPNFNPTQAIFEFGVAPDGKYVAAVLQYRGNNDNGASVRWTTDGVLDTTYSQDGVATVSLGNNALFADFHVLPSGRTILAANRGEGQGSVYEFATNGNVNDDDAYTRVDLGYDEGQGALNRVATRGSDAYVISGRHASRFDTNSEIEIFTNYPLLAVYDPRAANLEDRVKVSFFGFQPTDDETLLRGQATAGVFTSDGNFVAVGVTSSGSTVGGDITTGTNDPAFWANITLSATKIAFSTPASQRVGEAVWVEGNTLFVDTGATAEEVSFFQESGSGTPTSVLIYSLAGTRRFVGGLSIPSNVNRITINTFGANDIVKGTVYSDLINAGTGDDSVTGSDGNDTIEGGAGRDTLIGDNGNDVLLGGAGQDFAEGRAGNDSLYGGADQDNLFGGSGNDLIEGGASNDFLVGEAGNDALIGGSGNDTMNGGSGTDFLDGNDGIDTELFRSSVDTRYNMEIFA